MLLQNLFRTLGSGIRTWKARVIGNCAAHEATTSALAVHFENLDEMWTGRVVYGTAKNAIIIDATTGG